MKLTQYAKSLTRACPCHIVCFIWFYEEARMYKKTIDPQELIGCKDRLEQQRKREDS